MIYYQNIATYLLLKFAYFSWSYMILAARLKDVFRDALRNGDQGNGEHIQTLGEALPVPEHPGQSRDSPELCLCVRIGKHCCVF